MKDMDKMAVAVAVAYVCYRHPAIVGAVAEGLKNAEKAKALQQVSAAHKHAAKESEQADNDLFSNARVVGEDGNGSKSAKQGHDSQKGVIARGRAFRGTFFLKSCALCFSTLPSGEHGDCSCDHFFVVRRDGFSLLVKNTIAARFLSLFGLVHVRSLSDARNVAELGD